MTNPIFKTPDGAGQLGIGRNGMKSIAMCVLVFGLSFCTQANGQGGIVTTVAGNGTNGFSEDSGMATSSEFAGAFRCRCGCFREYFYRGRRQQSNPQGVGQWYHHDGRGQRNRWLPGDGGPATSAALSLPVGVTVAASGSLHRGWRWLDCLSRWR